MVVILTFMTILLIKDIVVEKGQKAQAEREAYKEWCVEHNGFFSEIAGSCKRGL